MNKVNVLMVAKFCVGGRSVTDSCPLGNDVRLEFFSLLFEHDPLDSTYIILAKVRNSGTFTVHAHTWLHFILIIHRDFPCESVFIVSIQEETGAEGQTPLCFG